MKRKEKLEAVIIAGGQGKRMDSKLPKALTKINRHQSILIFQINYLIASGVGKIVVALGYKAEEVIPILQNHKEASKIEYVVEKHPRGTAGALKLALTKINSSKVLVLNCDDIANIDIKKLSKINSNVICVAHPRLPFGVVKKIGDTLVFTEKPILENIWSSCGWYLFQTVFMQDILPSKGMLEYDVFPKIGWLTKYNHKGYWFPLNSQKDLEDFNKSK